MAKKKNRESCDIGSDMNGRNLCAGDRVEISPHFDLWMRGARFGQIRGKRKGLILVKMDNTRVRKLFKVRSAGDLKKV